MTPQPPTANHDLEAAKLGFDVTKQFLTLAIGGIAFVVGLSFSTPGVVSSSLLWLTVGVFAVSACFGLFFLLHGVNIMCIQKSYDIYSTSLRVLASAQILLVAAGVVLLCPILYQRPLAKAEARALSELNAIRIQISTNQTLSYPVDPKKNYQIEMDNGHFKFSTN